ncbi:unnamed protein product [Acanthosepion pharaonis]|uniref:Integrase catalytic domain-containing protein n=1 Tax=Acanthosepion pharaonis TaxID=158019 RepID=A0A812B4L7_ACAPH|nr:unnamed protein product [Sepia pharaonis]
MGMFAHYSQWIASFSEKIHPLTQVETFPLSHQAVEGIRGTEKGYCEICNYNNRPKYSSDISAAAIIQCLCSLFAIFGAPAYIHSDRGASFMSEQLRQFLQERGVAISRTTPYNPKGNGQCERYNGIIWKTVQLAASNNGCSIDNWENLLPVALYAIRSLLCTATNATPHERFLPFQRRSSAGASLPSWLSRPGTVFLRRHARYTKNDPLVDEVELIEANPRYALGPSTGRRRTGSWIAPEDRPTTPDTEAPPEDHDTEIVPVSVEAPSDTSDGPTPETLTDEGLAPNKRVHPETDSDAERPAPLRRKHFGARYFRVHRQARTEEPPCSSTPTTNHGLMRRPLRTRGEPGHLRDFLPYQ